MCRSLGVATTRRIVLALLTSFLVITVGCQAQQAPAQPTATPAVQTTRAKGGSDSVAKPECRWPPRVIYNTDGNWVFNYLPERKTDNLMVVFDALRDTSVDAVSILVGIDDDVSWRGSPHAELFGDATKIWNPDQDPAKKSAGGLTVNAVELLHKNLVTVIEDGHDLLKLYIGRGHQHGLGMYAAFRMNDAHVNDERRSWFQRSSQKKKRPDLLIGTPAPTSASGHVDEWNFSWQWDYAQPEVRERFLGLFNETLTRYDFDGIELDFCRAPLFFKTGQAFKNLDTLTNFMRKARKIVERHQAAKGKPIKLLARVPTSIDHSLSVGIDTARWLDEGLADVFILGSAFRCTNDVDFVRAIKRARKSSVLVYAGFDSAADDVSPQDGMDRNPASVMRAVAFNGYQHGTAGVWLFNYDYASHRQGPVPAGEKLFAVSNDGRAGRFTAADLQTLRDLGDHRVLNRLNRCYYLSNSGSSGDHRPQVPRKLALVGRGAGLAHSFRIAIKEDIAGGLADGRIKSTQLRLRLTEHEKSMDQIRCQVNGKRVDLASAHTVANWSGQKWLVVENPPIVDGINTVLVVLEGLKTPEPWPTLHQCEVIIKCQ